MKKVLLHIFGWLAFLAVIALIIFLVNLSETKSITKPDTQGEVGVILYSASTLENKDQKDYYLIYIGEMQKPIKVEVGSVIFKYDANLEVPQAKLWMTGTKTADRAEIWFRDKDQIREYLR